MPRVKLADAGLFTPHMANSTAWKKAGTDHKNGLAEILTTFGQGKRLNPRQIAYVRHLNKHKRGKKKVHKTK